MFGYEEKLSSSPMNSADSLGTTCGVNLTGRNAKFTKVFLPNNSAAPIADRLTNITFDIVEGSAKGSVNLAGKLVNWSAKKIINLSKNGLTATRNYISNLRSEMLRNKKAEAVVTNEDIKQASENNNDNK